MTLRRDDTLDLGSWCILRCSNCKTLELAASLTEAGFDAWSPLEWRATAAGFGRWPNVG